MNRTPGLYVTGPTRMLWRGTKGHVLRSVGSRTQTQAKRSKKKMVREKKGKKTPRLRSKRLRRCTDATDVKPTRAQSLVNTGAPRLSRMRGWQKSMLQPNGFENPRQKGEKREREREREGDKPLKRDNRGIGRSYEHMSSQLKTFCTSVFKRFSTYSTLIFFAHSWVLWNANAPINRYQRAVEAQKSRAQREHHWNVIFK